MIGAQVLEGNFVTLSRAARIVAPIADEHQQSNFEGGIYLILQMLAEAPISTFAASPPPDLSELSRFTSAPFSQGWFAELANVQWNSSVNLVTGVARYPAEAFLDWAKTSLMVSHRDVVKSLRHPFSPGLEPASHFNTAGVWWSFPQVLAWVATRNADEVARIGSADHFGPPAPAEGLPDGMTVGASDRSPKVGAPTRDGQLPRDTMLQSYSGRRKLVGWLAMVTAIEHCKCSAKPSAEKEKWESCSCLGNAYDEVRRFGPVAAQPIPRYQPQPEYGSFILEWCDEVSRSGAYRADVLERWPDSDSVAKVAVHSGKSRPGPKPDPDWPAAIDHVVKHCLDADYKVPLKRGQKAGIQTMLLTFMAAQKDKHYSDDTAAKYAKEVIRELPQREELSAS